MTEPTPTFYGDPLSEWQEVDWWPTGREHQIHAGSAGHERELVLNIDGYGWGSTEETIPTLVVEALATLLPQSWKVESRGTRIECHPTGRLFNGFTNADIEILERATRTLLDT